MARIAIVILIPIVALLVWRDWVLERQFRLLTAYDAAHHDRTGELQIALRDERIDDAMWKLLLDDPAAALEAVDDVSRMPAPTAVPQRAWRIASAASCALGEPRSELRDYMAGDARVRQFCASKK
jgi:hypothetical protein